jgi:tripartite-type tricarboxylate transporter receptor subunit TctC
VKRWLVAPLAAVFASLVLAQGFPERPVRIIVPLPPGGSPDTIARTIAAGLQGTWSQPVVVENRTGGSQNIGADAVAKSPPDGYTWLLAPDNVFVTNPYIARAATYDPFVDLLPVTEVARIQFLLVVPSSLPVNSVKELIAYAKAHPGELNFGTSGNGSPQHLSAALLQLLAGIKMNHVPYKGAAPAIQDVLAGHVDVMFDNMSSAIPNIKAGRLRALGVASLQRYPALPDLPTIAEQGVPGYETTIWLGLFAPAKTPPAILARLQKEIDGAVKSADYRERLAAIDMQPRASTSQELAGYLKADLAKWAKVVKEAGIKPE